MIWYFASNIILLVDSNTVYLILSKAKSRVVGYFYLSDNLAKYIEPMLNTSVLVLYKTIHHIVSLVAKVKIVGVFLNAQLALPIRYILEALSYL